MTRRYLPLLLFLAALWGASFLFIKVAVRLRADDDDRAGRPAGVSLTLRRARPDDVAFLLELLTDVEVEPFLSVRGPRDRAALLAELERSNQEPEAFGRLVVELDGERAGTLAFERTNERSRIARLGVLAIHPRFRGRLLADEAARLVQRHLLFELGYHRLELEIFGFNERPIAHAERVGFVCEGVKRRAYLREDGWATASSTPCCPRTWRAADRPVLGCRHDSLPAHDVPDHRPGTQPPLLRDARLGVPPQG